MGDYHASTSVSAPAGRLFDYLADVENLPKYFAAMRSAEETGSEEVHTVAEVEGQRREGDAHFVVDETENRIRWESEGPSDYSGWLQVSADGRGDSSRVDVHIHTDRVEDERVQQGVERTVAEIKRLVEETPEPTG